MRSFYFVIVIILTKFFFVTLMDAFAGAKSSQKNYYLSQVLALDAFQKLNSEYNSKFFNPDFFNLNNDLLKKMRDKKLPKKQVELLIQQCSSQEEVSENPFCILFLKIHAKSIKTSKKNKFEMNKKIRSLQLALKRKTTQDIEELENASETELIKSIGKIKDSSQVKSFSEFILSTDNCYSSGLLVALALRLENEFPDEKYKDYVEKMYEKAIQCKRGKAVVHAAYRLGLMKIWKGQCNDAERILSESFDLLDYPKFRMRIAYWRLYCAEVQGNEILQAQLRKWMSEEYPLSLHGLLSKIQSTFYKISLTGSIDPEVQLSSKKFPELNLVTRTIEFLIMESDYRSVYHIFNYYLDKIQNAEPAFQLYYVVLMKKSENNPMSFQLLATILKKNPEMISKSTLEMLYPLYEFEAISKASSEVNPYLILSLMRQESAFLEKVKSPAGAYGLMQLLLPTARTIERKVTKKELYNPQVNIRVGSKHFSKLLQNYGGNIEDALAAYNAGPGRIKMWRKRYPTSHPLLFIDLIPNQETREYISSILRNYFWYSRLYGKDNQLNKTDLLPTIEN